MPIIFDIETAPSDNAAEFMDEIEPPKTMKIAATIDKWRKEELPALKAAQMERAALSPITGKILCIGYCFPGDKNFYEGTEIGILSNFWREFQPRNTWIGFNSNSFDWPFIIRRSMILGVEFEKHLIQDSRGYFKENFIDLMRVWQCGNRQEFISLDKAARLFGVGKKSGNGADFAKLYAENRAAALEYLANDLEITRQLAIKMGAI